MRSMRRITEPARAAVARRGCQDSTGAGALASNDFDASPGVERRIATGSLPRSQPGGRGERLAVPPATRTHGVGTGPPPPRAPSRTGRKAPCAKENCQQVRTISSRCLVASMTRSCEWCHPDLRAFTLPSHPHVLRATEFSHASCVNSGCALPAQRVAGRPYPADLLFRPAPQASRRRRRSPCSGHTTPRTDADTRQRWPSPPRALCSPRDSRPASPPRPPRPR